VLLLVVLMHRLHRLVRLLLATVVLRRDNLLRGHLVRLLLLCWLLYLNVALLYHTGISLNLLVLLTIVAKTSPLILLLLLLLLLLLHHHVLRLHLMLPLVLLVVRVITVRSILQRSLIHLGVIAICRQRLGV